MEKLKLKVGDKFGEWTVIDTERFSKHGHVYVQCQCSCGAIRDVASTALLRGKTLKGNVQWVTYQANLSKHVMTMEQLYEFCRKVLNHANQQPSQPLTKLEGSETN